MRTLPAGVEPRLSILKSLDEAIPATHSLAETVKDARFGLEHHITQLRELNLGNAGSEVA
jgi:hypothetical protein